MRKVSIIQKYCNAQGLRKAHLIFCLLLLPSAIIANEIDEPIVSSKLSPSHLLYNEMDALLSITVIEKPLVDTLAAIADLTGISIQITKPIDKKLTIEFTDLPLDKALTLILHGTNRIMVYDISELNADNLKLDEVYVISSHTDEQAAIHINKNSQLTARTYPASATKREKLDAILTKIRLRKNQQQVNLEQSRQKLLDTLMFHAENMGDRATALIALSRVISVESSQTEQDLSKQPIDRVSNRIANREFSDRYLLREFRRDKIARQMLAVDQ